MLVGKQKEIPINKIKPSWNSRVHIEKESLHELMASIKETGVLQPIGLKMKGNYYYPVWGNRRFAACKKLGMKSIPAIVLPNNLLDVDAISMNIVENLHRKDITPYEQGRYFCELHEKYGLSFAEVAKKVAMSTSTVAKNIRLFKGLPKELVKDLPKVGKATRSINGGLSPEVASKIIYIANKNKLSKKRQEKLYTMAKAKKLTGRNIKVVDRLVTHGTHTMENALTFIEKGKPVRFELFMDKTKLDKLTRKYKMSPEKLVLSKLRKDPEFKSLLLH